MKLKSLLKTAVAAAIGLTSLSASAETYRASTWNAANSMNDQFLTDFTNQVKKASNGKITFEIYTGGALLPADGTLPGLSSGVAHIANITTGYIPSEFPVNNVVADLSFLADDQMALAFAATEVNFFNPQLRREWQSKGVVFATGFTIGIYNFICSKPVNSLSDLAGKKIRTSSSAQNDFIKTIGGAPLTTPAPEIYTGLQLGVIDCTTGSPEFLTDFFKLAEVAKSVYLLPLGSNANGGYYFNKDFWAARTPDERRMLLTALSRATAKSMIDSAASIKKAWDKARAANIKLVEPEDAAKQKLATFNKQFLDTLPSASVTKRKIADPTELVNQMVASIDKWKKLLSGIDTNDVEAVTALLDREIFAKVDVSTYGLK